MMQPGYAPQTPFRLFHDQERAALRRRALMVGWVLLSYLGMSFLLGVVIYILRLSGGSGASLPGWLEAPDAVESAFLNAFLYLLLLGVPVLIGFACCRKCGIRPVVKQKMPATHATALLAAGLAACVFANFASSLITAWLSSFGLNPPSVDLSQDGSLPVLLITLVSTAVLPAIIEELLFRGVILQLLRPAGDRTALILSAFLFGVTHGTIQQIPFAFIVGLACGYYVLKTGNLFLGMALHFLNNALSVLLDYAFLGASDAEEIAWTFILFAAMTALGAIGWLFLRHQKPQVISPIQDGRSSWLTSGERHRAAWLSPTILVFIALMMIETILSSLPGALEEAFGSLMISGGLFHG